MQTPTYAWNLLDPQQLLWRLDSLSDLMSEHVSALDAAGIDRMERFTAREHALRLTDWEEDHPPPEEGPPPLTSEDKALLGSAWQVVKRMRACTRALQGRRPEVARAFDISVPNKRRTVAVTVEALAQVCWALEVYREGLDLPQVASLPDEQVRALLESLLELDAKHGHAGGYWAAGWDAVRCLDALATGGHSAFEARDPELAKSFRALQVGPVYLGEEPPERPFDYRREDIDPPDLVRRADALLELVRDFGHELKQAIPDKQLELLHSARGDVAMGLAQKPPEGPPPVNEALEPAKAMIWRTVDAVQKLVDRRFPHNEAIRERFRLGEYEGVDRARLDILIEAVEAVNFATFVYRKELLRAGFPRRAMDNLGMAIGPLLYEDELQGGNTALFIRAKQLAVVVDTVAIMGAQAVGDRIPMLRQAFLNHCSFGEQMDI